MITLHLGDKFISDNLKIYVIANDGNNRYSIYEESTGQPFYLGRTTGNIYYHVNGVKTVVDHYTQIQLLPSGSTLAPRKGYTTFIPPGFLSLDEFHREYDAQFDMLQRKSCDCGGFKTYNSYAKEFHSHWCSSQKESV